MTRDNKFNISCESLSSPLIYDKDKCIGCNKWVNICQVDLLIPANDESKTPTVLYPGECWYCGCCVMVCPVEGALTLRHPLMNQANWIEKDSLIKLENK